MLMTCRNIVDILSLNEKDVQKVNAEWNGIYIDTLKKELERAFNYYLGYEANKNIALSRNKFNTIQAQALRAIAFLKHELTLFLRQTWKEEKIFCSSLDLKII
ncbi:MAG: hypothetical protein HC906_11780 [Bacteroidales bacterium]|nr:hypothetical protein [Bacteroidales bacterium]